MLFSSTNDYLSAVPGMVALGYVVCTGEGK